MADNDLFEKGLEMRRQVLGAEYVDANLASSDEFMMTFQRAVTELASKAAIAFTIESILIGTPGKAASNLPT